MTSIVNWSHLFPPFLLSVTSYNDDAGLIILLIIHTIKGNNTNVFLITTYE